MISALLLANGITLVVSSATHAGASTPVAARVVAIVPGPIQHASGQLATSTNRTDQVKIRVQVHPGASVTCDVELTYRGKVFGGGSFEGPVPAGNVTIPAAAYSRTRTIRGVEHKLQCAPGPEPGAAVVSQIPFLWITTEGP
jgi:hypothetical protein